MPVQLQEAVRLATRAYGNVERMLIERVNNPDDYVLMYINPRRIAVRWRKVIQRVQTNTRWVFQHWGQEPVTVTYSGVTGYMNTWRADYSQKYLVGESSYSFVEATTGDKKLSPYETPAFQALQRLRTFYEEPHKQMQGADLTQISGDELDENLQKLALNLYYRDTMFIGYFTRLEIREDEMSPWMWDYDMEFTAYETQESTWKGKVIKWENREIIRLAQEAGLGTDSNLAAANKADQVSLRLPYTYKWTNTETWKKEET